MEQEIKIKKSDFGGALSFGVRFLFFFVKDGFLDLFFVVFFVFWL